MFIHSVYGVKHDTHLYRFYGFHDKAINYLQAIDYSKGSNKRNDFLWKAYMRYSKIAWKEFAISQGIRTRYRNRLLKEKM